MKWNVLYTNEAERDLRSIYEYIAFHLLLPETAKNITNSIIDEIAELDNMTFRYQVYSREPWKSKGIRFFTVKKYMVFYLPVEKNHTAAIIRIMYGGRNIEKQMSENIEF